MCTPTLIGIGIGATIGGIKGGPKGALIGGVAGGLGGYALGPSGARLVGTAGTGPFGGTLTSTLVTGTGGQTFIQPATSIFAGGGGGGAGLLGGIFSPQFALGTQLVGFGFQAYGAIQKNAYDRARLQYEQGLLRNRQIAARQNIDARQLQLQIQLGIIGAQGQQARGDLVVDAAGRNVLVGEGSELDKTQQLAGDVAFQKELARHRVQLQDREDEFTIAGLTADSALLDFERAESQRELAFGLGSAALKTAAGFSKFRFNRLGQLQFRT